MSFILGLFVGVTIGITVMCLLQINNVYNLSARDYYQLYKTQQAKLPENLSKAREQAKQKAVRLYCNSCRHSL